MRAQDSANSLRRTRWEFIILACMYAGYMAFILCRTAIQAGANGMLADPSTGLTKAGFGEILAWGTAGMVAGKLGTGLIADAFGGRRVFLLALFLASLTAVAMGLVRTYPAFAAANFLMLFSAAAGWPAMASIISAWYPPAKLGKVWGIISTSSRLSSVLSMFFLGLLVSRFPWPTLFFAAGALSLGVTLVIFFFLKANPAEAGLTPAAPRAPAPGSLPAAGGVAPAFGRFLRNRRFYLMCASLMATTVMMEFIGFLPLYLKESFGIEPSVAATASSAFPAGCLLALIGGGFVYDRVSRKNRIPLLGGLLSLSSLCLAALWLLPAAGLSPVLVTAAASSILFFYGLAVAPAYYLPMSVFSVEFGGANCGLLIGLIDASGYAASMVYQAAGGHLVEAGGWERMLGLLLACSIAAITATVWFAYEDYRAQNKND
jgi:MFS transporter, OPA family, sugar phosphate sensor protein UhpC